MKNSIKANVQVEKAPLKQSCGPANGDSNSTTWQPVMFLSF